MGTYMFKSMVETAGITITQVAKNILSWINLEDTWDRVMDYSTSTRDTVTVVGASRDMVESPEVLEDKLQEAFS